MNYKRKSRSRFCLLTRSRTSPITSEFRGGGVWTPLTNPLGTPLRNIPEDLNVRNFSWFQWQPLWKCRHGSIVMFNWTKRGKREKCRSWQSAGSKRQATFSWTHDQFINVSWFHYQIFESMELNNSWEVNSRSVSQKFPVFMKTKDFCRLHGYNRSSIISITLLSN